MKAWGEKSLEQHSLPRVCQVISPAEFYKAGWSCKKKKKAGISCSKVALNKTDSRLESEKVTVYF